jgi:hypothetical protein
MTQMLKIRIPPANTERRSDAAFQRTRPAALYLRPRRGPGNEKPSEDLSFDFQAQNPARARAGFLLFRGRDSAALACHEAANQGHKKIATA